MVVLAEDPAVEPLDFKMMKDNGPKAFVPFSNPPDRASRLARSKGF